MNIKLLSENARTPTKGSLDAAGYDLYSACDNIIQPHDKALIKTDISLEIPKGYYGRIAPRSSMAWKKHTDVGAGVIDSDYRGPIGVVLFNLSSTEPVHIEKHDKIAQLIFEKCYDFELHLLTKQELNITQRNEGGFGSTGK
jgi:dUTP pyrophosphatase